MTDVVTTVAVKFPPALNNLFLNVAGRGRVKTPRYRAWLEECGWMIARQRPKKISGPFAVEIFLTAPDKRRRDLDGLMKAPLDLLVSCGVVDDDSLVKEIIMRWETGGPGARIVVRPFC